MIPDIQMLRLPHAADLPLPAYQSQGAAGFDLMAALDAEMILAPGEFSAIPTGLQMAIPEGWEGQVRPRSGLAFKAGITVLNSPGTIDCDYRGEVKVILINHGAAPFTITHGMRIAQMVIAPAMQAQISEASALDDTDRGASGFGSTGTK